jgi:hypothetical protein
MKEAEGIGHHYHVFKPGAQADKMVHHAIEAKRMFLRCRAKTSSRVAKLKSLLADATLKCSTFVGLLLEEFRRQ